MTEQIEIPIPEQPLETTKFKRGETAFMVKWVHNPRPVKIVEHYEFKNAYRVSDSAGERIVTEDEMVSAEELARMQEEASAERKAKEAATEAGLADVVFLWNQGFRTAKEMGDSTGKKPIQFLSRIHLAKRRNLIA